MKKYIALLTALSILAANGTTVVSAVSETSDGNSETVSVSESEKKECLISILLVGNYLSDFIKSYQKTLEEEGVPADEVLQIKSAIYDQLSENGRLTDDELEAKRLEFISEETNKDIDSYLSQIGIDRKETEITDVSGWYGENKFNIKASLTESQIETADTLKGCYKLVTVGEEIEKYKGKIGNKTLLNAIRAGNDNYNVAIDIQTDSKDMTDSEYTEFAEKILSPAGVAEFKYVKKFNRTFVEISANVSSEQLIGICAIESVTKVSGTDGLSPTAEPTEEPTSEPTSAPSVIPTFAPDFGPKTGDVNCDFTIDVTDLSELSLALIGDRKLSEIQQKVADVDGDGKVTLSDLARMRQYLSKVITSFG
ncbi:MAG: dockerin type I domain-containing protein [Oscillospiraceae bacterium]|nr:dockerin type I domain-containing protein [Oscillospiraceae bacterium]